jgi:hypothetical protein
MRFIVLAIDHGWQRASVCDEDGLRPAREQLSARINQIIEQHAIDLISEECDPRFLSIAQKIANEREPRIPWLNIYMSAQERLEAGIYDALLHRPRHNVQQENGMYQAIDHRIAEDEIREQFFATETTLAARNLNANSCLILCGDMHAEALADLLTEEPEAEVITIRDLVPEQYWQ